jgi:MarR family transcriptional regulator, organic hydroperoxide resistance regulator
MTDYTRKYGPAAIGARLRRLSESIDEDARKIYAELGIGLEQRWVGVIEQLAIQGPSSVSELASSLGIRHPSVSQTRQSLEEAGLIEWDVNPSDKRSRRIRLSASGRKLYRRLAPLWELMNQAAVELNRDAGDAIAAFDRLDEALKHKPLYDRIKAKLELATPRRARGAGTV